MIDFDGCDYHCFTSLSLTSTWGDGNVWIWIPQTQERLTAVLDWITFDHYETKKAAQIEAEKIWENGGVYVRSYASYYEIETGDENLIHVMIIPSAKDLLEAIDRLGIDSICNYDRSW